MNRTRMFEFQQKKSWASSAAQGEGKGRVMSICEQKKWNRSTVYFLSKSKALSSFSTCTVVATRRKGILTHCDPSTTSTVMPQGK
jgi:hypothetical protein